jgi:hypothetical protein
LGDIGLDPETFYEMSFFEYQCVCEGYEYRQAREWDRVRTLGFYIFKSVGDKKSQSPSDIMEIRLLDGDKKKFNTRLAERLMAWKLKEAQKEAENGRPGTHGATDKD